MTHVEYRLIGCPGAGKTTTLSRVWLPRAAQRWGPHSVAVCSLTRAAAAEIASRDSGIPKEAVGTLHALCWRALERPTIAEGKVAEWNAYAPAWALSGGASSLDEPDAEHRGGDAGDEAMAVCQVLRHRRVPRSQWPVRAQAFDREWTHWCEESDYVDFTGLIETALDRVDVAPGAPRVLVVDEVQDCSALEMALIRKWAARAEYVVLAGDPWQSIYQWRGADPDAFTGTPIEEDNQRFLSKSHRCPAAVHAAASVLVSRATKKLPHRFEPRDAEGRCVRVPAQLRYAESILGAIERPIEGGTMLLASCGFHVEQICQALRSAGIPFHNPYRKTNGRWNPLRGGARRVASFLRPSRETHGDAACMWNWSDLASWTEMCTAKDLLNPRAKEAIKAAAKSSGDDGDPLTSMEIQELFQPDAWGTLTAARTVEHGRDEAMLAWLRPRLLSSWEPKAAYALRVAEKHGTSALVLTPEVVVGTIHSTKGAQAGRVIVFPDLSQGGMREWSGGPDQRDAILRLFYVALTRSREELLLASPSSACHMGW